MKIYIYISVENFETIYLFTCLKTIKLILSRKKLSRKNPKILSKEKKRKQTNEKNYKGNILRNTSGWAKKIALGKNARVRSLIEAEKRNLLRYTMYPLFINNQRPYPRNGLHVINRLAFTGVALRH